MDPPTNKLRQRSGKKNRLLLYITGNHCNKAEGCLGFRFDFWGLGSMWFNKVVQICSKLTKMLLTFDTISPVLIMISTTKLVCCVLFLLFFLFLSFSLLGIHYLILTCRYLKRERKKEKKKEVEEDKRSSALNNLPHVVHAYTAQGQTTRSCW